MQTAPIPENEKARLEAVKKLNILDTPPEKRFDYLTKKAIQICKVPIAVISILDEDREWFKSCQGLSSKEGERSISFCGHTILQNEIFIIEDTLNDPRFADNPHVVKEGIRFYAGVALREKDTHLPVGVFCLKDRKPRKLSPYEISVFLTLAKEAEEELNKKYGEDVKYYPYHY